MSAVNLISQGYIVVEKRDRVSNVMTVKKDIGAMIEWVGFVIREVILSMVSRKYKGGPLYDLSPIPLCFVTLPHKLSRAMAAIKAAG